MATGQIMRIDQRDLGLRTQLQRREGGFGLAKQRNTGRFHRVKNIIDIAGRRSPLHDIYKLTSEKD